MADNNESHNVPMEDEMEMLWREMDEALIELRENEEPHQVPDPQEHEAMLNAMADVLLHNFQQVNPDWNPLENLIIVDGEEPEGEDEDEDDEEDEELELELERRRRKKALDSCATYKEIGRAHV